MSFAVNAMLIDGGILVIGTTKAFLVYNLKQGTIINQLIYSNILGPEYEKYGGMCLCFNPDYMRDGNHFLFAFDHANKFEEGIMNKNVYGEV